MTLVFTCVDEPMVMVMENNNRRDQEEVDAVLREVDDAVLEEVDDAVLEEVDSDLARAK